MSKIQISQLTELSDNQSCNVVGGYSEYVSYSFNTEVFTVNFAPKQFIGNQNSQIAVSTGYGSAKNNGQNGGQNIIGDVSIKKGGYYY